MYQHEAPPVGFTRDDPNLDYKAFVGHLHSTNGYPQAYSPGLCSSSHDINNQNILQHHKLEENRFKKLAEAVFNTMFLCIYLIGLLASVVFGILSFVLFIQLGYSLTAMLGNPKYSQIPATFAISSAAALVSYIFGDYC
ncbi:uncharacterized protein VICG_01815 [Vittaforma corneae ATCC 50505]|uniref:Uncharacterized protein n=1 Tax=Vittaforma corneae (strain ATCC 50505) TaxID=993615 RepID=L2GJV5_VITCO|nr:uncharacterized protein VICG_01815 [Vittaforma corneae ATCC 50505]ELA41116.1 hypothetical protein VICG_01815 [Vittaforma corneae ATCC 50505]